MYVTYFVPLIIEKSSNLIDSSITTKVKNLTTNGLFNVKIVSSIFCNVLDSYRC